VARTRPAAELAPSVPSKLSSVVKICAALCDLDAHNQSATNIMEIPDFLVAEINPVNPGVRTAANLRMSLEVMGAPLWTARREPESVSS
jgi:hypothetical protein